MPNWLEVSPLEGIIEPGGIDEVFLLFYAHDLEEGSYDYTLEIKTNDYQHPEVEIPIYLSVLEDECSGWQFGDLNNDYTLNINAQDGKSLIGSLHTPPKPELIMYPNSIYPDSLFNISWNSPENSMVQIEVESWDYPGCYIYKSEYFENGEIKQENPSIFKYFDLIL